jgi:hypothetical protein
MSKKNKGLIFIFVLLLLIAMVTIKKMNVLNTFFTQYRNGVDTQIYELFEPTYSKLNIYIDKTKYVVKINSVGLTNKKEDYMRILEQEINVLFSLYKGQVKKDNLLGQSFYYIPIKRSSVGNNFFIVNDERNNNIVELLDRVLNVYYKYYYFDNVIDKDQGSKEYSSYSKYDYSLNEYDDYGNLKEANMVNCELYIYGDISLKFSTEFIMPTNEQEINIYFITEEIDFK